MQLLPPCQERQLLLLETLHISVTEAHPLIILCWFDSKLVLSLTHSVLGQDTESHIVPDDWVSIYSSSFLKGNQAEKLQFAAFPA